ETLPADVCPFGAGPGRPYLLGAFPNWPLFGIGQTHRLPTSRILRTFSTRARREVQHVDVRPRDIEVRAWRRYLERPRCCISPPPTSPYPDGCSKRVGCRC